MRSMTPASHTLTPITHRYVVAMAVPIMLANVSQPLLGIVDTADNCPSRTI